MLREYISPQRWPGFKSIFIGNNKLRIGKRKPGAGKNGIGRVLPAGVAFADAHKNLRNLCAMTSEKRLGLILELFKIRARRKLLLHGNLLSVDRLCPHRRLKEDSEFRNRQLEVGLALSADWMRPER